MCVCVWSRIKGVLGHLTFVPNTRKIFICLLREIYSRDYLKSQLNVPGSLPSNVDYVSMPTMLG